MESVASHGNWTLVLKDKHPLRIKPGAILQIRRVTLPFDVRPPDRPDSGGWRCRIILWKLKNGKSELEKGGMFTTMIPREHENARTDIRLFPHEEYVLELIGGGWSLHLLGNFLGAGNDNPDTILRPIVLRKLSGAWPFVREVVEQSKEQQAHEMLSGNMGSAAIRLEPRA
ncbi:hypothetical protein EST38_g11722 [Candolleomyces aberdarensis]|uniref:Uncharacterized protein n=1 Tax=Candolleomyces aberdarensis TaxID=2316362 RepID=A0A4Q2D7H5_9AGAR|nr:hypothetical protein EST38_g11722 [Candolleomyces aberdarensis]